MRILILFTFLITNTFANESPHLKNLVIYKVPKTYNNVIFLDKENKEINIKNIEGGIIILNFWATWCEPCKDEMPSLNRLLVNKKLKNLKIFPINIGKENSDKVSNFFQDFNINNLEPYFDNPYTLAKTFSLRGVPTTLLFNSKKEEFGRIIGSIDFDNPEFVNWLKKYN